MLVSFNWLKEYLDLSNITPNELAEEFTLGGLEVELTTYLGEGHDHLVIGEVLTVEAIEGSEHLKKTTVDVGDEILPIVCGAPNCVAGQKVIVAKIGAVLPGNIEIKQTEIMDETSKGMICSLDELGFSDSVIPKYAEDGIYVLQEDAVVGADARPYVGLDDSIMEFDLTPNRADALSMRGMAYDAAALLNQTPQFPEVQVEEDPTEKVDDYISVAVEDDEDTSDYKMRIVKNVTIGESPLWMQRKLMHAGMRPIDLVVDVTNYVMLEYGQPLHAFDYDKLEAKEIYVRRAKEGEEFTTLDGQDRKLTTENLVITNGHKAVALAGVMGGANSQITEETNVIAIESAVFKPVLTRRTAAALNLRSEASSRFEKGINKATVQEAADLAAQLIAKLGGGQVVSGTAESTFAKVEDVTIETTVARVDDLIGTDLDEKEIATILDRLGFENTVEAGQIQAIVPPRRWDVRIEEDLVEEIARIYGYNNIPATLPVTESTPGQLTVTQAITREIRHLLEGNGLEEAISYALMTEVAAVRYAIRKGATASLKNPLSKERTTLRQNIISGLIEDARYNQAHQVSDIALYEIGHVFYKESAEDFREYNHLAGLLTGEMIKEWFGQAEAIDFYTVKGLVETLLSEFAFTKEISYQLATDREGMHPGRTADVYIGEERIGYLGQIHPNVAQENDLKDTFVFELSLDKLVAAEKRATEYTPLSPYPGSSRDIALLVDASVTHAELEQVISENGGKYLSNIHLFDLYAGENIEDNKKSVAYSLYFVNPKATLKEEEVNNAFNQITEALVNTFKLEVR